MKKYKELRERIDNWIRSSHDNYNKVFYSIYAVGVLSAVIAPNFLPLNNGVETVSLFLITGIILVSFIIKYYNKEWADD